MRILQINSVVNSGSTGRIAEDIGRVALEQGHESYIAFGRGNRPSQSKLIRIGSPVDVYLHGAHSMLFDRHGFASKKATAQLVNAIDKIQPDVIGLHNLHGYYVHIGVLFGYLRETNIPVLWTLFDCWTFTGHCSYFDDIQCDKWLSHCHKCPKSRNYPKAYIDNSFRNFSDKKRLFTGLKNMELVVHSNWLAGLVKESFLQEQNIHVLPSGIDIDQFKPTASSLKMQYGIEGKKIILGCASIWTNRKGYQDFINLHRILDASYQIVMVGLNNREIRQLHPGMLGLPRTESIESLAQWYTAADVFVNPTSQDNFPTTNLEALACGTPVITYRTGGSPEAIDSQTGLVVDKGDINGLVQAIYQITDRDKSFYGTACRSRAENFFDKNVQYSEYLNLFSQLVENK